MGHYIELVVDCLLKSETPESVIETLKYMMGKVDSIKEPNHPLFSEESRWATMLRSNSGYYDTFQKPSLKRHPILGKYMLRISSSFKNYEGEVQNFWNWIKPWVDNKEVIAHFRTEGGSPRFLKVDS